VAATAEDAEPGLPSGKLGVGRAGEEGDRTRWRGVDPVDDDWGRWDPAARPASLATAPWCVKHSGTLRAELVATRGGGAMTSAAPFIGKGASVGGEKGEGGEDKDH